MKHLLTFCLVLAFCTGAFAQQWYQMAIPHARNMNDVVIKSKTDIQIAGGFFINDSMESMFRSTSEGIVWDFLGDYPGHAWIESFAYNTPTTATAVGTHGKIKHTTDGGLNWTYGSAPLDRDLSKIVFTDNLTGYVVGRKDFDSLQTIWKTVDGGQTFTVLLDQAGERLNSVAFVNATNGFAIGDKGTMLATANSGANWNAVVMPVQRNLKSIYFTDASNGFIVGGDDSTRTILYTTDAGSNWNVLKDEAGACLNDVWFLNSSKGFIAGDNSLLLRSTDGGQNWLQDTIDYSFTKKFTAVRFLNDSFGFVAAHGGSCFIYTQSTAPVAATLNAMVTSDTTSNVVTYINTYGYPGSYQIISATDSNFSSNVAFTYPQAIVTDSSNSIVTVGLGNLLADSNYYYRVFANTLGGSAISDIGHFYTGSAAPLVQTTGATAVTGNSAALNGFINHIPENITVTFEYGLTPFLGVSVSSIPGALNANAVQAVGCQLNGLQANSTYYYRVKAQGSAVYSGEIRSFYTGALASVFQTNAPVNITAGAVQFEGTIDQCSRPTTLVFEYGVSPVFTKAVVANPTDVNDANQHTIMAWLQSLAPLTQYQVRLRGQTSAGDLYGNVQTFTTGAQYDLFKTLAATGVTSSGAQLHGLVEGLQSTTGLSFEYGTTTNFGSQITANPSAVTDTATHQVSAMLTGLLPNVVYYVRLRGNANQTAFYGDTIQFYTGSEQIPNWDFQVWESNVVELPTGWNLFSENFAKVSGHTGNALQVAWPNVAVLGMINDKPTGGQAFAYRPDSISFYLKYNMQTTDTGLVLVQLLKGSTPVSENVFFIHGTYSPSYKRFSAAVNYTSPDMPDSLVIGVIPANPFSQTLPVNTGNYIAIDDVSFGAGAPAVLNGDMEDWFSYTYERLPGWYYPKFMKAQAGITSAISKTWFAQPDDYAVQLSNVMDASGNLQAAGIENLDKVLGQGGAGFPCTSQHQTLNGVYKFNPLNHDTLQIMISFSRNGNMVGYGSINICDTVSSFKPFEVPITFDNASIQPDSADILIRIGTQYGVRGASVAAIDKLTFDNPVGISNVTEEEQMLTLIPNPATSHVLVNYILKQPGTVLYQVFNNQGALLISEQERIATGGKVQRQLTTEALAAGVYLVRINTTDGTNTARLVVTH